MTEKFAATLVEAGYAVTVIGFGTSTLLPDPVTALPLGNFPRLSLRRYLARWHAFRLAFMRHADVFIFSTHELIFPALLLKVILGTRIIYDVRENYYRNIRHSEGLPGLLRWPLALAVRAVEKITAPAIDHFLLAEAAYDKEFRFHRGGYTVVENKALPMERTKRNGGLSLLFSGTLSQSTGVFRAMALAKRLREFTDTVTLTVAGYAASTATQKRIRAEAEGHPCIRLVGIDTLVPHARIRELTATSDAGIIAYPHFPHTSGAVPTKLFEYLEASLPILTEAHWPWIARFAASDPFVFVDFESPDASAIVDALRNGRFYTHPPSDASWSTEAPKLLRAIKFTV